MGELLAQVLVSGVLWGFLFSLIALGLTVIFGVVDIVNFAHGDFLMLAMYIAFWLSIWPGLDPVASVPLVALALGALGALTHRILIRRVLKAPMLAQIFGTFGLLVFLRGAAQLAWSPDYRTVSDPLFRGTWTVAGVALSKPQAVAAIGAILATLAVYLFITRTRTGWALQAVAEDREAASLMGIPVQRMYTIAWALGASCVGVAGALLAEFYYVFPEVGAVFGFLAFVTVALGGFGSVSGAFVAGLIIGMVEVLGGFLWMPAYKYLLVFVLYLVVVVARPQGLLGRV